jgi:hypothetical protein
VTAHLQLVPRSRKRGSIHPLPYTSSWRSAGTTLLLLCSVFLKHTRLPNYVLETEVIIAISLHGAWQLLTLHRIDNVWEDVWSGIQEISASRPDKFTEVFPKYMSGHYTRRGLFISLPSQFVLHIHKAFDNKQCMQYIQRP